MTGDLVVVILWVAIAVSAIVVAVRVVSRARRRRHELRENEATLKRLARDESARRLKRISALDYRERFLERRNGQ